ncbi:guanine nucleotide exchange factor subunit Rich isoform X2 [Oratosquilla oratoria]|uniref:guanine nucleotide exchange factor subunit Rich isoform X2 n=1 Tax=Oratosquilla oratoria TaxID=337810 RepID=UPI003F75F4B0
MYYSVGLPKLLKFPKANDGLVKAVVCNRDRILYAVLTERAVWIWFSKPCVPIVVHHRSEDSIASLGTNELLEWRPDSSMIVVSTNKSHLIFYSVVLDESRREVYEQCDSYNPSLRRESAELYIKEAVPPLVFAMAFETEVSGGISCLVCIRDELMICTRTGHVQRYRWDATLNYDYCIDLRRIPFCDDQLVMKAIPLDDPGVYVTDIEYSPLVGGFAVVLSDGRAAFLTASTLKFDPNAVQGIWARDLDDATCAAINHKYRLMAYGKKNAQGIVYTVDEATGGLQVSHTLLLSDRDYSGSPGPVGHMKWTPDGTVLGLCWANGGISLWSVFGSLLTASLRWDYSDDPASRPISIFSLEWGAEGYDAWCIQVKKKISTDPVNEKLLKNNNNPHLPSPSQAAGAHNSQIEEDGDCEINSSILQFSFVKSALTVNPCMSKVERVLLQGCDRLFLNTCEGFLSKSDRPQDALLNLFFDEDEDSAFEDATTQGGNVEGNLKLAANKQWLVVPIPYTYTAANWPIRYTGLDESGTHLAVAGRNGVAHFSLRLRKWYLFGNESQERDFVVTGGLLWWKDCLVLGAYNIAANADELRIYPRDRKLDNQFVKTVPMPAQVLLLNLYKDRLIVLTADCHITVYNLGLVEASARMKGGEKKTRTPSFLRPAVRMAKTHYRTIRNDIYPPNLKRGTSVTVTKVQEVDISGLTVHPACVVSIALTNLRTESSRMHTHSDAQSVIINISGKVLMIQKDQRVDSDHENGNGKLFHSAQMTPIVLASCCEILWVSHQGIYHKPHLTHALWLHCGAHGIRAWLPLFPNSSDKSHTFMARRIMLPFSPSIYPLAIQYEEGIMVGAETDTSLFACDASTLHQPLCIVERTSQVYLHHILRQLLRRNLGYHAWEIANSCRDLPYFPHSLELLLHEVLEEEATSKDPLPDSLLPRVIEFIREFPVYLQTVVQCARKIELALWRCLFLSAGTPRDLFQQALSKGQLETAASYLIILQNMESASISRQLATRLLDSTLEAGKWDLSKDLIRFLRSIDPTDLDSPKPSIQSTGSTRVGFTHATPPVSPACADEDLSMIMPNTQALRGRSFSAASAAKAPTPEPNVQHAAAVRTNSSDTNKVIPPQRKRSSNSIGRDVSTAEEFFLDVILQRHAKKLLVECRLRDLGEMAAHLDFPLVAWLRRERCRAARVDDFVAALRHLHRDFSWPFPSVSTAHIRRVSSSSIRSLGLMDDRVNMDDQMQGLSITVPEAVSHGTPEVGDSGYLSQATRDTAHNVTTPQHEPKHSSVVPSIPLSQLPPTQALLMPRAPREDISILSEEGSVYGEDTVSIYEDWSPDSTARDATRDLLARSPDPPLLAAPKPPPHSEVQLRYLLQLLLEAGCIEWSIVVAVVLRDALALLRAVGLAHAPDMPLQIIQRLNNGLQHLLHFTNNECLGYQSFFVAIRSQLKVVQKLVAKRETALTLPSPQTSSGTTSSSSRPPSTHEQPPTSAILPSGDMKKPSKSTNPKSNTPPHQPALHPPSSSSSPNNLGEEDSEEPKISPSKISNNEDSKSLSSLSPVFDPESSSSPSSSRLSSEDEGSATCVLM